MTRAKPLYVVSMMVKELAGIETVPAVSQVELGNPPHSKGKRNHGED